jgi:hypothetical protein
LQPSNPPPPTTGTQFSGLGLKKLDWMLSRDKRRRGGEGERRRVSRKANEAAAVAAPAAAVLLRETRGRIERQTSPLPLIGVQALLSSPLPNLGLKVAHSVLKQEGNISIPAGEQTRGQKAGTQPDCPGGKSLRGCRRAGCCGGSTEGTHSARRNFSSSKASSGERVAWSGGLIIKGRSRYAGTTTPVTFVRFGT